MAEKPAHVEVSMSDGSEQVMFTMVYPDGRRVPYWKPFWRAHIHVIKLIWQGLEVKDVGL